MILSTPCSCGSSLRILMRPMMKSSDAQTYIQNAIAGMPNGAKARAGTTTANCWSCNAGRSPPANSSGDILGLPTKGSNQTVTAAHDSYWGHRCDFAKLGLGSSPRLCDSQSTCRKKYSGKYRLDD